MLLYGSPDLVRLEVIDQLLVTSVSARPLTADEIREKGIVYDRSSFQAYDFTAAFADRGWHAASTSSSPWCCRRCCRPRTRRPYVDLANVDVPLLRTVQTLIPDTLRIQARIPNLSVVGFTLRLDAAAGSGSLVMPPIPGVIVIPGDIGFLNQFFSVTLMVGNVAPAGSGLVVRDLRAAISLPPGVDRVVGSNDDPLRLARTAAGVAAELAVVQAGPDGKLGTGDDILLLVAGADRRRGVPRRGPARGHPRRSRWSWRARSRACRSARCPMRGRAAGAVLVRNPTFTLTFTHPDVVNAGEPYTLDVTVTNTSNSPANFVSLNLFAIQHQRRHAHLASRARPSRCCDPATRRPSATVWSPSAPARSPPRRSTATRTSTAASCFKTAIGELGVPLSPDSLVLPKEANGLPAALREATVGLLGRAWAVATAPTAAVPPDLIRFSKQVVIDRAVQAATTGLRISLGEGAPRAAADLWLDVLGSEYTQLASRVPANDTTGLLALLQRDVRGFDLVRRRSFRGQRFAEAIGTVMGTGVTSDAAWHEELAGQFTSRPGHVSILLSGPGAADVDATLVDPSGLRLGTSGADDVLREIPFGDVIVLRDGNGAVTGRLFAVAVPEIGTYDLRLRRAAGAAADAAVDVSIVVPTTGGGLRFLAAQSVQPGEILEPAAAADIVTRVRVTGIAGGTSRTGTWSPVADPAPMVVAVRQVSSADIVGCTQPELSNRQYPAGRVIAVLFSEQVTPESVQDRLSPELITAFAVAGTRVSGVALQPGRRLAYIALREGIGPVRAALARGDRRGGLRGAVDGHRHDADRRHRRQRRGGGGRRGPHGRRQRSCRLRACACSTSSSAAARAAR